MTCAQKEGYYALCCLTVQDKLHFSEDSRLAGPLRQGELFQQASHLVMPVINGLSQHELLRL